MKSANCEASGRGATDDHRVGLTDLQNATQANGMGSLWERFQSSLPDLFVHNGTEYSVTVAIEDDERLCRASTAEELSASLQRGVSSLLIINRYNSWSRMDITVDAFSVACRLSRVTPYLLHFILGMGTKSCSKDEDFMTCHSGLVSENDNPIDSKKEPRNGAHWTVCYNIRYFERHHRDLDDPWSCRQSAIHHSYSPTSNGSKWIVIQPPKVFEQKLIPSKHYMSLHTRYLYGALENWREYLDSFAQDIRSLNQPMRIRNPYHKFRIDFSHEQHLHIVRGKLHHASTVLANTKATIGAIADHETAMYEDLDLPKTDHREFQRQLRNLTREVDNYLETCQKLLRTSDDLRTMYSNILSFHGQELQHDASLKLAQLAQADATENRDMAVLADLTYKDSKSMRIATAIAMFYLPINLVIAFFSSDLVVYEPTTPSSSSLAQIHVRREVWVAAVAAMVLALGTVSWSWWWNWRDRRRGRKPSVGDNVTKLDVEEDKLEAG